MDYKSLVLEIFNTPDTQIGQKIDTIVAPQNAIEKLENKLNLYSLTIDDSKYKTNKVTRKFIGYVKK